MFVSVLLVSSIVNRTIPASLPPVSCVLKGRVVSSEERLRGILVRGAQGSVGLAGNTWVVR